VVQHVRPRPEHGAERVRVAHEVGNEHLHARRRHSLPDPADRRGEVRGPAVGKLVAVDGGDHDVAEPEPARGVRDAGRLRGSTGSGRPLRMSQKGQERVHTFPRIRNVAVRREKQSPMLGQFALSQTVCRSSVRRIDLVSR